jgi:hypothetical protein
MKPSTIGVCLAAVIFPALVASSTEDPRVACQFSLRVPVLPEIWEASGAALASGSPPRLWVINDSEQPIVYGVDPGGQIVDRVWVAGVQVQDWEDLSSGPCPTGRCLFIADIGDNAARRTRITVYRIPEPARGSTLSARAEAFHATYPDGPHNAESLFVGADERIYLITKGRTADVYRFPIPIAPTSTSMLQKVGRLTLSASDGTGDKHNGSTNEAATGAALSVDQKWVAVRSNEHVWFFRANEFMAGTPGVPIRVNLSGAREPQGEAISFGPSPTIYLVGEGGSKGRPGTVRTLTCALPE